MMKLDVFLEILILSGYNVLLGRKFYFDENDYMTNYIVKDVMGQDRFIEIVWIMHWGNNDEINEDKL